MEKRTVSTSVVIPLDFNLKKLRHWSCRKWKSGNKCMSVDWNYMTFNYLLFNKWNFVYKLALGILTVFIRIKSKIALRLLWCCLNAVLCGLLIFCFHFCVSTTLMENKKQSWHPQVYFLRLMAACMDSLREKGGGGAFRGGVNCRFGFAQSRVLVGKVGKPMFKIIPMNARSSYIWFTFSVSC